MQSNGRDISQELARARLEYLSAGLPPLVVPPRRAVGGSDHPVTPDDLDPLDEVDAEAESWLVVEGLSDPLEESEGGQRVAEPEADSTPHTLESRVRTFGKAHLKAICLLLLMMIGLSVVFLMRARATTVALPVTPLGVASESSAGLPGVGAEQRSGAGPMPSGGATSSASRTPVRVHVLGSVRRPGVVTLPAGARVQDAISAAGGLRREARVGELNLAAPVADGDQVVVGDVRRPRGEVRHAEAGQGGAQPAATSESSGAGDKLDLNTATAEQLDQLPGVGPVTAQHILDWRSQHGRFTSVAELQEVDGIGPKTFSQLSSHVRV